MLPKKITIGCYDYTIKEVDDNIILDNKVCAGKVSYKKHEIQICCSKEFSEQSREQTLWHEIVHAILEYRSIDPERTSEETLVDELALGLYGLCKNNGLLPGQSLDKIQPTINLSKGGEVDG